MDDDLIPNQLFVSLSHEFQVLRVIGNKINPVTIKTRVDIVDLDDSDDTNNVTSAEIALAKMDYWIKRIVNNSIMFSSENTWASDRFESGFKYSEGNNLFITPFEPVDSLLCEVILSKFKSLTRGVFEINSIELVSSDSKGLSFIFAGSNPCMDLPSGEEWLGERNWFKEPWWVRADSSTMDSIPADEDDLSVIPDWSHPLSKIATQIVNPTPSDNNVVRAEFRPSIIKGGKE